MVSNRLKDGCLSIQLSGEVDHLAASQLRRDIDTLLENKNVRCLHFDFSKVTFMDSSGIGMIIGRYKIMKERQGVVTAGGINDTVYRLFRLGGLHRIITIGINGGDGHE